MRSFIIAVVAAVLLAVGFYTVLNTVQESADTRFRTEGVRL
jgi:hypothetical protein